MSQETKDNKESQGGWITAIINLFKKLMKKK